MPGGFFFSSSSACGEVRSAPAAHLCRGRSARGMGERPLGVLRAPQKRLGAAEGELGGNTQR